MSKTQENNSVTEAILSVIKNSKVPLTTGNIAFKLSEITGYGTVAQILYRLKKKGIVQSVARKIGNEKGYSINPEFKEVNNQQTPK